VDIYSLGIVMYQILNNNRTPFLPLFPEPLHYSDKEQASQKRVSGAAIPPPCNADQELAEIVLRACAYDSANRYQTPGEMKRDLMELLPSAEAYPDSPAEVESTREGLSDIDTEEKTRFIFDQYTEKGGKSLQGEAANADASGDSSKKGPGRRLRSAILLCILLIALLCGSVAAYRYYHHAVPSVVGMEPDGAKEVLRDAGLRYAENGKEFSDRIEQGQILSQNRAKGEKVKKGTVVTVVISRGKKIIIPKLRGISLDQANREMSELGLVLREEKRVFHDTVKKDCIVSQKPDEGSVAEKGTGVTVVISKGVEKVAVPNIEGKDRDTARRKLREAGLKVSESESYSNSTPKGYVIYQTVEPDNKIKKKSKVGIVISLGPEPVTYTQDNDNTSSAKKKSSSKSLKKGHGNIV
jgi:serine/threonine-protein kinase